MVSGSLLLGDPNRFFDIATDAIRGLRDWTLERHPDRSDSWIKVAPTEARVAAQGWKLHVSATISSAESVLRAVLPVLVRERAVFKVAGSPAMLLELNEGWAGLSQVGKFITAYPAGDASAVRLARALDAVTAGMAGPAVPSDRAIRIGSLVHYRYGGFARRLLERATGETVSAIADPAGNLVPDRRTAVYEPPSWVSDPFAAAGLGAPGERYRLIGGRFLEVGLIHRSPRGSVHGGVDVVGGRPCVLKRSARHGRSGPNGLDAGDFLRHEASVLRRLAGDARFPAVFELLEDGGDLVLAMEDVEGLTLANFMEQHSRLGRTLPIRRVIGFGRDLADLLGCMHVNGLVYRDLKSANVIVAPHGRLRLVDFELTFDTRASEPLPGIGTRGYRPRRSEADRAVPADDVYGLGAVLYLLVTGEEPSRVPDPYNLMARPPELLNPAVPGALSRVISRCLAPDPAERWPSMEALSAALAAVESTHACSPAVSLGAEPDVVPDDLERAVWAACARRLGAAWCDAGRRDPQGLIVWADTGPEPFSPNEVRSMYAGSAGVLLALAELTVAFPEEGYRSSVEDAAFALAACPVPHAPRPGLYFGEAGVAAALLRAGQALGRADLVTAAAEHSRVIAGLPYDLSDLTAGTAGRLRLHLLVYDETGDSDHLAAAATAGEVLLATASEAPGGGRYWELPPEDGNPSGVAYLGYAHGAAGIADTLLDLFDVTGDRALIDTAADTAAWLARQAMPALDDGTGLTWPPMQSEPPAGFTWCHGSAGIARFLIHAARSGAFDEAGELAIRAGRLVARGGRAAGPSQCHGLAGNIELLLDLAQWTGDELWWREARSLARLLEAFIPDGDRPRLLGTETRPGVANPGYMTGAAGVAVCLLRLADRERRPHQLSREGFRLKGAVEPVAGSGGMSVQGQKERTRR